MILVSVIIPTYNRISLVEAMIKCIIAQTYTDWELILVDDGSIDGTYEMMLSTLRQMKRFLLLKRNRSPKGGQVCRNIGFDNSKGKYVIFFDSDDLISRTCLEKRVRFMQENDFVDFGIFKARSFQNIIDLENRHFAPVDYTYGINKNEKNPITKLLRGEYPFAYAQIYIKRHQYKTEVYSGMRKY